MEIAKSEEEQILDEIVNTVIEKEKIEKKRVKKENNLEATLQALHEVTGLSKPVIEKLASEIIEKHKEKSSRSKSWREREDELVVIQGGQALAVLTYAFFGWAAYLAYNDSWWWAILPLVISWSSLLSYRERFSDKLSLVKVILPSRYAPYTKIQGKWEARGWTFVEHKVGPEGGDSFIIMERK